MDTYYLDNGIPIVDVDAADREPWTWTCPVPDCEHVGRARDESTARHDWFGHTGQHDLVVTWPDTFDLDVPDQLAHTRIRASEQAAMSARPMSRPAP